MNSSLALSILPILVVAVALCGSMPNSSGIAARSPIGVVGFSSYPASRTTTTVASPDSLRVELNLAARTLVLSGSINSVPNSTFTIEFLFFASGPCESLGHQVVGVVPTLLGSRQVITDGQGNATFLFEFLAPVSAAGGNLRPIITDSNGNSSEVGCFTVLLPTDTIQTDTEPAQIVPYDSATISGDSRATISGTLFGEPATRYGLNFVFTPEAGGNPCSTDTGQSLNSLPIPVLTDEAGKAPFSVVLSTPTAGGFVNCQAVGPGSASARSSCFPVGGCPPVIAQSGKAFDHNASSGALSVIGREGCEGVGARSLADWISITHITPVDGTTFIGSVSYSVTPNDTDKLRIGFININEQLFTVSQAGNVPPLAIGNACKGEGKQLIVNGSGFAAGARVLLNGMEEKTSFVSSIQIISDYRQESRQARGHRGHVASSKSRCYSDSGVFIHEE